MDRISGLSDELLIKILLFVPTKVAISTSVLSKRWEYLWMWLPKLDFCSYYPNSQCKKLQLFLDRNMPLHRAPIIETLRLELRHSSFEPANIKLWIVIAISRRLRELEICYSSYPEKPNILPSNLFTSNSLVVLKLVGKILLDVPRMVFLPCLKTFHLENIIYSNKESLRRILSNSPILEDLLVELCDDARCMTEELTIVSLSLKSLSLVIPPEHIIDGIVIETPSLEYLKLIDHTETDHYYLVENMPKLIETFIDVYSPNTNSITLIRSITSVTRLVLCLEIMYDEVLLFNKLEHLEVCTCTDHSFDILFRLLNDSPYLQALEIFQMEHHDYPSEMPKWKRPSTVPKCLLSSLQTFQWWGYTGEPDDKDLTVYILKNATRLKTATIKYCKFNVPKYEMLKALALPRRASRKCKLVFLD